MDSLSLERSAGILLHPTCLYTPYGIGDLGPQAYSFIEFLQKAGQKFWQILPLGPTGYADSPYQTLSAFAGNPLLISPDGLVSLKLLSKNEILEKLIDSDLPSFSNFTNSVKKWKQAKKVDYPKAYKFKEGILQKSYQNFIQNPNKFTRLKKEFTIFCKENHDWLDDYVLFYSIKNSQQLRSWIEWPEKYANRDSKVLFQWKSDHQEELEYLKFVQWLFFSQWMKLKHYANSKGIEIIGDMPIFVAHDSVDVWSHRELFTVDKDGNLIFQAGVPPDYFSETGQLWGNPLYNWDIMAKQHFQWFIQRFKQIFQLCDWIRIDHFRGFQAYWKIPASEKTAVNGKWIKAPGLALFNTITKSLGKLPIIAEDLGVITPEVTALRNRFNFPGMKVLQFAFTSDASNPHLPHNISKDTIAYTGTHDNDTTLGWWQNYATDEEKAYLKEYIGMEPLNIVEIMIRLVYSSRAIVAMLPLQDVFGQGSESRMNTPSTTHGNWQYQIDYGMLTDEKASWLKHLTEIYGRNSVYNK
ncbi:MAG: 4-alpha-glucanotransferase [Candidatus Lokiarchaeota archaeon]|nr:4-alpha-glucanotransferase [Candidatus Harpocratesius repetitus]